MGTDGRENAMSTKPDQVFHTTSTPGLAYRQRADGSKSFYGWLPNRGRVKLQATAPRAAAEEYRDLRGKVAKGEKVAPANLRFMDVAEEWIEQKNGRLREWTRRGYRASLDNELIPRFGHRKLREITVDDIAKFVRTLESRGLSSSTIENHLKPLSGTFRYAVRRGLISTNPVSQMTVDDRPEKRVRSKAHEWTPEEIASIFTAAEVLATEPNAHADYTSILRTAVYTGLRLGELLGLQWQDVDLDKGTIEIQRQFTKTGELAAPKTKAALRRIPIRPELVTLLKNEKEAAFATGLAKPEDFVFPSRTGGPKLHRTIQRAWENVRDKAKLSDELTFHDLRHAYASVAVSASADPIFLSKVMGHTDPAITMKVYTHLFDRPQREATFRKAMVENVAW